MNPLHRCPQGHTATLAGGAHPECDLCEMFLCPRCENWTHWADACTGERHAICHDCYAELAEDES